MALGPPETSRRALLASAGVAGTGVVSREKHHGDPVYYEARPRIAVPKDQLIAADAFFGMHPALAPLLPLWSSGGGYPKGDLGRAFANAAASLFPGFVREPIGVMTGQ